MECIGIGFEESGIVGSNDMVFVGMADFRFSHKPFPDATAIISFFQWMRSCIIAIPIAHDTYKFCMGSPYAKVDAVLIFSLHWVRAKFFVEFIVGSLFKEVDIKLAPSAYIIVDHSLLFAYIDFFILFCCMQPVKSFLHSLFLHCYKTFFIVFIHIDGPVKRICKSIWCGIVKFEAGSTFA